MTDALGIPGHPNLRPFRKGQSGNPSGKKPDLLLKALHAEMTPEKATQLAQMLMAQALDGDIKALTVIWDRLEGKVIARAEQGGPDDFASIKVLKGIDPNAL